VIADVCKREGLVGRMTIKRQFSQPSESEEEEPVPTESPIDDEGDES
jgi:hypothetical protein